MEQNKLNGTLRPMREEDLDDVVKIEKECFDKENRNDFLKCLSRAEVYSYFVYVINNEVTGYYGTMNISGEAELLTIAVKKSWQGNGIGELMMRSVILECSLRGSTKLFLEVNENNNKAIGLYKKTGFIEISRRPKYYGNDTAIIMQKEL